MGGGLASTPNESTAEQMRAYIQYLPQLLQTTAAQQPGIQAQQLAASNTVAPGYLAQEQQYALPAAQVGQQVQNANTLAGSQTQLADINGPGGQVALSADSLNRMLNPQWYALRDTTANQAGNLVNSINLNGLSGGETAAVERSLNQSNTATGNLGLDNATNAVSNAMNFGNYLNTKRTMLGQALQTAAGTMSGSQTSFNPVATALSQPTASDTNLGTTQFAGNTTPGNQATQFGSGALGNITNAFTQAAALRQNSQQFNSAQGVMQSLPSYS